MFGRGFGEAISVHVESEWMLVDSCLNPQGEPAALHYLQSIGVQPSESVCLVLVTHWDDDHVAGVSRIVEECEGATVACSLALRREEIFQFVLEQGRDTGSLGSGVDELRTILTHCRSTPGRLIWAKATLPLHPRTAGGSHTMIALSPSDDAVSRSIESLIELATGETIAFRRRYRAPEGPNGASVAATVQTGETSLLLGADLENADNPATGWDAVLAYARPAVSASIVKVPHHGSDGAHHADVWSELVDDDPVAIVTPWVLADGHLPTKDDLTRLRGASGSLYLTAMPTMGRVRKDSAVEKLITKVAGVRLEELRGWGQVRVRRGPSDESWRVELDGDARPIE